MDVWPMPDVDEQEEMYGVLRGLGFEPRQADVIELREAVPEEAWIMVRLLLEHIGIPAARALARKVAALWRAHRRHGIVKVLLGPDGEVIAEVRIEDARPDEDGS